MLCRCWWWPRERQEGERAKPRVTWPQQLIENNALCWPKLPAHLISHQKLEHRTLRQHTYVAFGITEQPASSWSSPPSSTDWLLSSSSPNTTHWARTNRLNNETRFSSKLIINAPINTAFWLRTVRAIENQRDVHVRVWMVNWSTWGCDDYVTSQDECFKRKLLQIWDNQ